VKLRILIPAAAGIVVAGAGAAVLTGGSTPAGASLTAATTAQVPVAAQTTDVKIAKCDLHSWADRVQGRPSHFAAHDKGSDYLWHGTDGFHLRVTHRTGDRSIYTGAITASASIVDVKAVRLEKADKIWLSANHRTLYFRFANYGGIDGADFRTDCATSLTAANLKVGSDRLPTSRVYLGATKAHPAHIPFTVHREH
jgi:hypothetical protein